MSSSGGNGSEPYSFAAPGGPNTISSPDSTMGTDSSANADVITMPTGSQISERSVPPARNLTDLAPVGPRRSMRATTRSTSPITSTARSPRRSIEKRRDDDRGTKEQRREIQLGEELRSARNAYNFLHEEYECIQAGYSRLHHEAEVEFRQMSDYNRKMQEHLQEMTQEDEGATIRIEELEHKLRLAESTAEHIYMRYQELAQETHQEHSELESVKATKDRMSQELQAAIGHIQEQNESSLAINRRSKAIQDENTAFVGIADQIQARMIALQDENVNMHEVIQHQREEQWNSEVRERRLQHSVHSSQDQSNQEAMVIDHLRGQLAMARGAELNARAEIEEMEVGMRMEIFVCQTEVSAKEMAEMKASHHEYEANVAKEVIAKGEIFNNEVLEGSIRERQQLKDANLALSEANAQLKRENMMRAPMFGDDGAEIQQKIRELENALLESQKETKNVIMENAKLKAEARMAPIVSRYSKRPSSRDRGLPTHASEEDEIRNAKEEAKHYKDGYNEMTESRDEMYEWYAETHNEYAEEREKSIELSEANKSLRDKISEAEASSSSHLAPATSTIMKVSRKEESKINVPSWPRINDLGLWKANLIQSIIIAANDSDQEPWIDWIKEAMDDPDPDKFVDSGDQRFHSIDAKLGLALTKVVMDAKDDGSGVAMKLRTRINAKGRTSSLIKGREVLALILMNFKTTSNVEVLYTSMHLYQLEYQGDKNLSLFFHTWDEILAGMKPVDVPSDETLRDLLWRKIRNSNLMAYDISAYNSMNDDDAKKTYKHLRDMIRRHIERQTEDRMILEKEKAVKNVANIFQNLKPGGPAPKLKAAPADPKKKPKGQQEQVVSEDAAAVKPKPNPKKHPEDKNKKGKGKGKGDGKDRSRSPSTDKKKIPCKFFVKGNCTMGKDCPFSHKKPRSPSRGSSVGKNDKPVCWMWIRGTCDKGKDCKFYHDPKASPKKGISAPADSGDDRPKPKAKPKPKPKAKPGAPAIDGELFMDESEDEGIAASAKAREGGAKVSFDEETCEIMLNEAIYSVRDKWKVVEKKPLRPDIKRYDEKELTCYTRKEQIRFEEKVAEARGILMVPYTEIKRVRIPVGPKGDLSVTMSFDEDDGLVFHHKVIPHVCEGKKDHADTKTLSIPAKGSRTKFIMDTGCGYDLISKGRAKKLGLEVRESDQSMSFYTANGVTSTKGVADIHFDEFDSTYSPFVLDESPSVLSVGKKCMEEGYTFIWPACGNPYMVSPNYKKIMLEVEGNIPYIVKGSDFCNPTDDVRAEMIARFTLGEGEADYQSAFINCDVDPQGVMCDDDDLPVIEPPKVKRRKRNKKFKASPGEEDEVGSDVAGDSEPEADDDDADDIEVDIVDGASRMVRRGTLKADARKIEHLLTHRYKNPYCESCIRAKMKHFKTHRGAFKRKLKAFGDLVTFDFVDTRNILDQGISTDREIFVIRDRYTGVIWAYPSKERFAKDVVNAINHFKGLKKIKIAYADKAPEFETAMKQLKIPFDHSLPNHPQNNSLAERNNQFIMMTTATCLLEAGLPPCFWSYAVECVSHLLNIEEGEDGVSPWYKLHGKEFHGEKIPFGAKVFFMPSSQGRIEQKHKFDPKGIPGIFAGYEIKPGMNWSRQYRVWSLETFAHQSLAFDANRPIRKLLTPQLTETLVFLAPIEFPLKEGYEKINNTLEGMKIRDRRDGEPEVGDPSQMIDYGDYEPTEPGMDFEELAEREIRDEDDEDAIGDHEADDEERDDPGDDDDPKPDGGHSKILSKPAKAKVPPSTGREDHPPVGDPSMDHMSMGKASDGIIYLNDDGETVKLDRKGNPYKVGSDGRRFFRSSPRPRSKYTPEEWKALSLSDRAIAEKKEALEKEKMKERESKGAGSSKDKRKKKKKEDKDDDPKDVSPNIFIDLKKDRTLITDDDDMGGYSPSSASTLSTELPSDDDYLVEWEEWTSVENGFGPRATWDPLNIIDVNSGEILNDMAVAYAMPTESNRCTTEDFTKNLKDHHLSFPSMPCINSISKHRERYTYADTTNPMSAYRNLFNAAVSRPVSRAEMLKNPKAKASMRKEWLGLHEQGVFDFSVIREYHDVKQEALTLKQVVHFARVHGIIVEKNYQLPMSDERRKFKGRGVLLGNKVKNQNWEAAFFQDLGNSPASFESSRWADFYGCVPGHSVKLADAIQAYIQASLTGPPCWVELPSDAWPDDVDVSKYHRPVVRLLKALYGHPDAGTMWEKHCDTQVRQLGFKPIGDEWPSMYFHEGLKLLLVIYVDDLKLAGPTENMTKGWSMLRTKLRIEPETDLGLYLGCMLTRGESKLHDGTVVNTVSYNMEGLLKLSVEKYLDIVGHDTKLKKVTTPSVPEETKSHPARAPAPGKEAVTCPWCANTFDPKYSGKLHSKSESDVTPDDGNRGSLAPHAASILMKLLYAARIARFDLLRSINMLARNVNKWTSNDDARLHHLMCYVNSTLDKRMIGWVGDPIATLSVGIFADADFAGCGETLRSTSGSHMHVQGKHTRFPIAGGSKRQGCISHSTPEAEIVAADSTLRNFGIPSIGLWQTLSGKAPEILFHDDNQGMIGVARTGKNPTMRHLERTHGISIVSLHEHFQQDHFVLLYEISHKMCADIHTKAFRTPLAWRRACMLINLLDPEDLSSKELADMVSPSVDHKKIDHQIFQTKTDDIPNFPYTQTPVLPRAVFVKGMTGKEGVQDLPNGDCIYVVKVPVYYRRFPPGRYIPSDTCRSTWVLVNGSWNCVEREATPLQQALRFDHWVERACFLYHASKASSSPEAGACLSQSPFLALANVPWTPDAVLQFSIASLSTDPALLQSQEVPLNNCHPATLRVINTLLRLVHGGSGGQDGASIRAFGAVQDHFVRLDSKGKNPKTNKNYRDEWRRDGDTLTRVHNVPRTQEFVPSEDSHCPVRLSDLSDYRRTERYYKSGKDTKVDSWRFKGNSVSKDDPWIGSTTFLIVSNGHGHSPQHETTDNSNNKQKGDVTAIATGIQAWGMNTIAHEHMFIAQTAKYVASDTPPGRKPVLHLVLQRRSGRSHKYQFELHQQDVKGPQDIFDRCIMLQELERNVPCLVLMCAEEQNWFTFLQTCLKKQFMNIVTITEDDDACSAYGINKVKACVRSSLDCVFFAGPCTGGSAWNRLNRTVSIKAEMQIEKHQELYWSLWNCFAHALDHVFAIGACALTELPRSCEYWRDDRMTTLIEGTESHVHDFDGCMYGLATHYGHRNIPIKKPWRIVSWGVQFQSLMKKCDHKHQHAPCAGRETRVTQLYTLRIAQHMIETLNKRALSLWKKQHVASRAPVLYDWSRSPHPSMSNGNPCSEVNINKRFDKIIQSVHDSKKKKFTCENNHDTHDSCASVITFHNHLEQDFEINQASHFGAGVIQQFAKKKFAEFHPITGGLSPATLPQRGNSLAFVSHFWRLTTSLHRGDCVVNMFRSTVYGATGRSMASAKKLKEHLQKLDSRRGESPTLVPRQFVEDMDPGQALQLAEKWMERGVPPVYSISACYCAVEAKGGTIQERLVRSLRVLLSKYDPETDDGKEVTRAFFAGIKRVIGIVKSQERQVRPEHKPLGPPPPPNPEHFPYEAFASNDVWDRLELFADNLLALFMPEPFNQEAPVKGMLADLNEKVAKRGMKGINSTAMSKDSLLDITRDGYFYDSMNDLHHRIPIEGRSSNYVAMTGEHWERSCRYISLAGASLGFALRFHNKNHPEDLTSLTDLIQIIAKGQSGGTLERCAAINNFQCIQALYQCIHRHVIEHSAISLRSETNAQMLAAFQHLKEWFPEVKPDVWTAGYNVLGAELGVHRDLLARDTSISILNQYIAELHLSEANLDEEPDLETLGKPKEKIYLTFENPSIGPPNLKDFSAVEPQWLCQFRIHHAKNKGLSQDEITKQMREEARRARDQSGAPKNRDDYTQTFGGKGSSVPPGGPYTSSSSGPRPPWERNNEQWDPWSSDVPHGAYDVPRPPPKAPPKCKPMPKPKQPAQPKEWFVTLPPEGVTTIGCNGMDYLGKPIIFNLWTYRSSTTAYATAPFAGPRTAEPGRDWRQYVRRLTYYVGVTLGGNYRSSSSMGLQPLTDSHLRTKVNESDGFWTKLYVEMVEEFDLTSCFQYPSARAMVLILKLNDVPEEAAYHIKFLSSKVGCHTEEKDKVMIDGDTGVMDVDHLSGQIRGVGTGHTILVTDLDYATRASSSKKITTMQYGIRTEMAFENCCVFQVQGERHQDILDTLDRVVVFLEEHGQDQGDGTTVHIWLCLHCMFPNGSTLRLTEATFKEFSRKLAEKVHSIGQLLTTPVLVNIQPDSKFFGPARYDHSHIVTDIVDQVRRSGALATKSSRAWKAMYSVAGAPSANYITGGDKNKIWAVMEKQLTRERVILLCSMNKVHVSALNNMAEDEIQVPISQDNFDRYLNVAMSASDGQPKKTSTKHTVGGSFSQGTEWRDIRFVLKDPEPEEDRMEYWMTGNRRVENYKATADAAPYLCEDCNKHDASEDWNTHKDNRSHCVNCNFNFWCVQSGTPTIQQERESIWETAVRVRVLWEKNAEWNRLYPAQNLREFMVEGAMMLSRKNPPWIQGALKAISHHGGIRAPSELVEQYCTQGKGSTLFIHRDYDPDSEDYGFRAYMDYGNVAYHDYIQYFFTHKEYQDVFSLNEYRTVTNSELAGDIMEFWTGVLELAGIFKDTLFEDWAQINECRRGIEMSFLHFYAASRKSINDNTKRNKPSGLHVTAEEQACIDAVMSRYATRPEFRRMVRLAIAPEPKRTSTEEPDVEMKDGEADPASTTPGVEEPEPPTPELDPQDYKDGEGRSVSPTKTWSHYPTSNPDTEERKRAAKRSGQGTATASNWKTAYDNLRRVRARAVSQKVCYCCGSNQHHLAICPNTEKKDELMNSFSHMEDTMRKCFTEDDKAIIRRDVESRKRKAKSSKDVEDEDYMDVDDEDIELPEEEPELGGKVPPHSPRAKGRPHSSDSAKEEYAKAVEATKKAFGNASFVTRFKEPVDLFDIADDKEGGEYRVANHRVDRSGPDGKRELDALIQEAAALGIKMPKVKDLVPDPQQVQKAGYRQIEVTCDRGNIEIIPQYGVTFYVEYWNGPKRDATFTDPPKMNPATRIDKFSEESQRVNEVSHRLNRLLRHGVGKHNGIQSHRGRKPHVSPKCNEGGWVNIDEILEYDHVFNDGVNISTISGTQREQDTKTERYQYLCKAMWHAKKLQNRVRYQIAAIRISKEDVSLEEERQYWANLMYYSTDAPSFLKHERWIVPCAIRAVASHNSGRETVLEEDVSIYPVWTSHLIPENVAMQLGGSFHMTSLSNIESIMKLGIVPGGTEGYRGSVFFNHFAPWDDRSSKILRSRWPRVGMPVCLYVPIMTLRKLGGRISENSYTVVFREVPWRCVRGAWYWDDHVQAWRRLLLGSTGEQVVLAARHGLWVAQKHTILERADEVTKSASATDDNVQKLVSLIDEVQFDDNGELIEDSISEETWDEIISRTCEGYRNVDGNILCPSCMHLTSSSLSVCLSCQGRLLSCGIRNTVISDSPVDLVSDDEEEKKEEKEPEDDDQDILDQATMDEIRKAWEEDIAQTEAADDDEDMDNLDPSKPSDGAENFKSDNVETPSFNEDEIDYGRDSDLEDEDERNVIIEIQRSTQQYEGKKRQDGEPEDEDVTDDLHPEANRPTDRDEPGYYAQHGATEFNPEEGRDNEDLPIYCRVPEPRIYAHQERAYCQDVSMNASGLMDRYVVKCVLNMISLMYKSYYCTSLTDFKANWKRKRLDVISKFGTGDSTEIDDDGRPLDPTDDMMLIFANDNNITTEEAWHRFRGEQFICKVALVILSFGHTPQSFKKEYGNFEYPTNLTDAQLEELKAKKASAMTELVQKCIHAIYGCRTYSYFRTDVTSPYHKVIDPLDIMYSRMKSKWEKSILLIIDQHEIRLPPQAQEVIESMARNPNVGHTERWMSVVEHKHVQALTNRLGFGDRAKEIQGKKKQAAKATAKSTSTTKSEAKAASSSRAEAKPASTPRTEAKPSSAPSEEPKPSTAPKSFGPSSAEENKAKAAPKARPHDKSPSSATDVFEQALQEDLAANAHAAEGTTSSSSRGHSKGGGQSGTSWRPALTQERREVPQPSEKGKGKSKSKGKSKKGEDDRWDAQGSWDHRGWRGYRQW